MVTYTGENIGVFIRKNRERNLDVERRMMVNLLNALKEQDFDKEGTDRREELSPCV